jgi:hypothetical protein
MLLPKKDVRCQCGHTMTLTTRHLICVKCARDLYYDESERRRHRRNKIYVLCIFAAALGFMAYLFIEIVAVPFFPR